MKRILLFAAAAVILLVAGVMLYAQLMYNRSFTDQYPVNNITIQADSAMIEHGRFLVYGPAHCAHCHTAIENLEALEKGAEVPMSGGFVFELPLGNVYSPNITPDKETGIGNHSDGELYRMLRYNIRKDGAACLELMPFSNMSDYDIKSVIAFIKRQKPVRNDVPKHDYSLLGKFVRSTSIQPTLPAAEPMAFIARDSSVAYGKYLCEAVANCRGCHTNRDLKTGAFVGEPYAGGFVMGPDKSTAGFTYITPNITFDAETGVMSRFDEAAFIARMRGGRVHQTSPMPWGPYSRLADNDLKAIYRFLKTVKPVKQANQGPVIAPEKGAS